MWHYIKIISTAMPPIKKMFVYLQPIYVRGRPRGTPSFIKDKTMIDKLHILDVTTSSLDGTDKYLVDLKITADNRIYVSIDGDNGILIDDCVDLSRKIENSLNRDEEDFELNVASAGLDSPLKLARQYKKNIGETLDVTTTDGEHIMGELTEADDEKFVIQPPHGKKKAPLPAETFNYSDVKVAKIVITF